MRKRVQGTVAIAVAPREESLEREPVGGQSRDRERGQRGRWTGQDRDSHTGVDGGAGNSVTRVGHGRHPRVRNDDDESAAIRRLHDLGSASGLVVLVQRDDPSPDTDAEAFGEREEPPRVLCGDHVCLLERGEETGWGIRGLAYRRCGEEHEALGGNVHASQSLVSVAAGLP